MSNRDFVQGSVAEGFERVRDEFAAALTADASEPGAQLAAYFNGRQVVDDGRLPTIDVPALYELHHRYTH